MKKSKERQVARSLVAPVCHITGQDNKKTCVNVGRKHSSVKKNAFVNDTFSKLP